MDNADAVDTKVVTSWDIIAKSVMGNDERGLLSGLFVKLTLPFRRPVERIVGIF